jgi:hypothetical protein
MKVLDLTNRFDPTLIVGFNELRGADLYNTALVANRGHLLGIYSKCAAYQKFHKQGRTFPVFERSGVKFGVIICADGGYIEPARILALKGARIIFAPHFNSISGDGVLAHFMKVRSDHTARAIENSVWFVRGNNVVLNAAKSGLSYQGVGYGDSYILDPGGEIVVRSRRHVEDFIVADIDATRGPDMFWGMSKSAWSHREFGALLDQAMKESPYVGKRSVRLNARNVFRLVAASGREAAPRVPVLARAAAVGRWNCNACRRSSAPSSRLRPATKFGNPTARLPYHF